MDHLVQLVFVSSVLTISLVCLARNKFPTDYVLVFAAGTLLLFQVISPSQVLAGFSNPGLATIAALYVVVGGLRHTGAVNWLSHLLLGHPKHLLTAQLRLILPAMFLSAFINNSPVVAIFTSSVQSWIKRTNFQLSQLLMPLSYAAILGGTCTLIGTSTNLVVNGLLIESQHKSLTLFELALVGIPACVIGMCYMLITSPSLLPKRNSADKTFENTREYMVEMRVDEGCELIGKTIEEAGLRHLPGLYLIEIIRQNHLFTVVSPKTQIEECDRLVFVGAVESVVELRMIKGLTIATDQAFKVQGNKRERRLFEAVVSSDNPTIFKTIRESRFRHRYNAAILAVSRNGKRLAGKVGDIKLRAGDTLLLEAQKGFLFKYQYSRDFLLINRLENAIHVEHEKAPLAIAIVVGMIFLNLFGVFEIFSAAVAAAGAMLVTGCINIEEARKSIDYKLLLTIAMAFALGKAIQTSGLADIIGQTTIVIARADPLTLLVVIYICTALLTEVITNNAAAIVMYPIVASVTQTLDVNIMPYAIAVMIAASASFITPIGYQTNLMVMGPGGYRFNDYVKFGLPLSILIGITVILIIPIAWPLTSD